MTHLDGFIKHKCQYCKIINIWLPEKNNTIQSCPSCKIMSYIKESPVVQSGPLEDSNGKVAG